MWGRRFARQSPVLLLVAVAWAAFVALSSLEDDEPSPPRAIFSATVLPPPTATVTPTAPAPTPEPTPIAD